MLVSAWSDASSFPTSALDTVARGVVEDPTAVRLGGFASVFKLYEAVWLLRLGGIAHQGTQRA